MGGGREGGWVMGIEEGTFGDEHWVLYGNQFDNKLHILKKKIKKKKKKLLSQRTIVYVDTICQYLPY